MTTVKEDVATLVRRTAGQALGLWRRAQEWMICDKRSLYGSSLARVLAGVSVLGLLLTNWRVRSIMFGPGAAWNDVMRDASDYLPTRLVTGLGPTAFTLFYLATMALAVAFVLGWHTRLVGPLMLIGNTAIIEQNPVLGDQGDNIIRIGVLLLCLMHTSEHWSLDARRRARTERVDGNDRGSVAINLWNSQRVVPLWVSNVVHNVALCALAFNVLLIYISAGMFKTQGSLWQHGTALYYPLQMQEYKPLPFLTDAFTHYGVILGVATYMAVFVQLFFAPLLLNKVTRRIAIVMVILLHLSIAVLMALPWFSLSMIAFDAIFVSTTTYVAIERYVGLHWRQWRDSRRPAAPAEETEDEKEPVLV